MTLYEAIEGTSPFRRDTPAATLAAVALHDPPPMRRAGPVLASLITALLAKKPEDRPTADSVLAILRAGTRTTTATAAGRRPDPDPTDGPAAPTEPASPPPRDPAGSPGRAPASGPGGELASEAARFGRLVTGTCLLVLAFGGFAFGCGMFITQGGDPAAYGISAVVAAVIALFAGLAAMCLRWKHRGRPPFGVVAGVFLSVYLPVAALWLAWNAVLLA